MRTSQEVWRKVEEYVSTYGWEGAENLLPGVSGGGGGPSDTQKAGAAQTLANSQQEGALANQSAGKWNAALGQATPFYQNEMQNGLPFYNQLTDYSSGTAAQAYAPAKAQFLRNSASMGSLPSGFKASGMNDINNAQAKTFDSSLMNNMMAQYQAKQQGAQGLMGVAQATNPAAFYGGSSQSGAAVMNPLQPAPNPWMGLLGGAVQGATSAIKY